MPDDRALLALAARAGVEPRWTDYRGQSQDVSPDTLRAVLTAMGLPCANAADLAYSEEALRQEQAAAAPTLAHDYTPPCWRIQDIAADRNLWGMAVQVYSLSGGTSSGFGDFAALAKMAKNAAHAGAAALAVSPVHALFAADPGRYGPYAPSTRLFLNGLYADLSDFVAPDDRDDAVPLIDWLSSASHKLARLHAAYGVFRTERRLADAFIAFRDAGGAALLSHARFEALDARFRPQGLYHWRDWPGAWRNAASADVQALAADDPEIEFHVFVQWLADRSLATAQAAAKSAGMPIGLIADLAVGMDGAGSHAWSRPAHVLTGLGIGAPPDLLGPDGQNWGLTTFSPRALSKTGFAPFLDTLRAAMRHAGGVRIDHVMGLQRLWVVPEGASATEGAYLNYPVDEMLRLTAEESRRHKAIVIGEDLGTVPTGFRTRIDASGILGMRVLWFERTARGGFRTPSAWSRDAVAMTTTHDLPTVVGWLKGSDIDWRERIDHDDGRAAASRVQRKADKRRLGSALRRAGLAPRGRKPAAILDAVLGYVSATPCRLAIVPIEDILAETEQPNLPGTIDEHPNWRRRLPPSASLDSPDIQHRLNILHSTRGAS